ncbi:MULTISPECIES: hypothetical protein [unclassified Psychromonas]|uniref:hypothetical protein n=1 Tax=unclassified Psychromonas TaxID=2614957 RepID=UPI0025B12B3B|nr:hypothetical protein [Psychromonas sp. 14N.309.X.WAT.B.A12]MDN2663064.1 hypothetical protein [Psychromonas sp. 14N.309.X.WAT.B.A12]
MNKPFNAKDNIATAGGCLASQYLAAWVIYKLAGKQQAEAAIHYVSPVSEKEQYVNHCINLVGQYI